MITTVALLGAAGIIPLGGAGTAATKSLASSMADQVAGVGAPQDPDQPGASASANDPGTGKSSSSGSAPTAAEKSVATAKKSAKAASTALPASGTGRGG